MPVISNVRPHLNTSAGNRSLLKQAAIAACLWLVVCPGLGFVVASIIGEHGSIIFAIFGLAIGIAGSVSHVVLLLAPRFHSSTLPVQVFLVWAGTMVLLVLLAAASAWQSGRPYEPAFTEALNMLAIYCATPTILAAIAFVGWLRVRPNPSIERTSPGKPGAASHLKR